MSKTERNDVEMLEEQIEKLEKKSTRTEGKVSDIEEFQKRRHEELI